jgi:hypothetical protein
MKNISINILAAISVLLVLACGSKENKANPTQNEVTDKSVRSKSSSSLVSPCDLITMDDIKNIFALTGYPIETQDKVLTHPTCIYKWEDGKVFSFRKIADQEIKMERPSEVLIVMVKGSTEDMFNRSTTVYKQPHMVPDLGDMAVWDTRMSQLTFLSHDFLFHVHVKVTNEDLDNKKMAIEVSNLIIERLE